MELGYFKTGKETICQCTVKPLRLYRLASKRLDGDYVSQRLHETRLVPGIVQKSPLHASSCQRPNDTERDYLQRQNDQNDKRQHRADGYQSSDVDNREQQSTKMLETVPVRNALTVSISEMRVSVSPTRQH